MRLPGRAARKAAAALTAACLLPGCASYTQQALEVRDPLIRGDLEGAQSFLEEKRPGGGSLPYLMELGLVLHYRGEHARSNLVFEDAEQIIDELYTRSISKAVLALATSDEAVPYDGEAWERVLINYYRALNYVSLGKFEDALVECRKINHKLKVYGDSSEDPPTYRSDAFAQYVTAVLYEAAGETGDALVSLRLADRAYQHYQQAYAVAPPTYLAEDFLRLATDQGNDDEAARLRERFPDVTWTPTSELLSRGEIVVFFEEGFIPPKIQAEMIVPLLKTEYEEDHVTYARKLSRRRHAHRTYKKQELEYLLRVAVPEYAPRPPGDRPGWAVVRAGTVSARSQVAQDLDAIARKGLDDRMGGILFKTILRGLSKYALTRGVESKKGELAGKLVNFLTAATEKADTRSWITLPRTIQVARLQVPPGTHHVELTSYGPGGTVRETVEFRDVDVGAGEVRILSHRTF